MKILHICLSNFYIDNMNYQENILPRIHKEQGNDVKIIASTEIFTEDKKIGYTKPDKYINSDGIIVERIPYSSIFPHGIAKKLRYYEGLYGRIEDFQPDIIFIHCFQFLSISEIVHYVQNHNVKIFIDSHTDFNNSAKSFISKYILHKVIYKYCYEKIKKYTKKFFPITYETKKCLNMLYGIPNSDMEILPLGGICLADEEYACNREYIREIHGISDDNILLIHSGKINKDKNTVELLQALKEVKTKKIKLFIIGSIDSSIESCIRPLLMQKNVEYLGWKNSDELMKYLCACDLYMQPGSQSVTMQNAACCRCALALYPHASHKYLWGEENVFYIENVCDIKKLFEMIESNSEIVLNKRKKVYQIALETLDYTKIASRIY